MVSTLWYTAGAIALMTVQPFAVRATLSPGGGFAYTILSATACSELLKLVGSLTMYSVWLPAHARTHRMLRRREVAAYAAPAAIFALINWIAFEILQRLSASTFQMLSTQKIIATALLFRAILKRRLTPVHYATIVLLAAGASTAHLPGGRPGEPCEPSSGVDGGSGDASAEWTIDETGLGVALTMLSCVLSGLASVLNEALLKWDGRLHSLCLQNALLYSWCFLFTAAALLAHDSDRLAAQGPFRGFTAAVWLLVVVNSATGAALSVVLKHQSSLVKAFASVCAMLASISIDAGWDARPPRAAVWCALVVVSTSAMLFAWEGQPRSDLPVPEIVCSDK